MRCFRNSGSMKGQGMCKRGSNFRGSGFYEDKGCVLNALNTLQSDQEKLNFLETKAVYFKAKLELVQKEIDKLKCQDPLKEDA